MITIAIQARPDGLVQVTCSPPIEPLYKKLKEGGTLSPEESLAVLATQAMLIESHLANNDVREKLKNRVQLTDQPN